MLSYPIGRTLPAAPPSYDLCMSLTAPGNSALMKIVSDHLQYVNQYKGPRAERKVARNLASHLVAQYNLRPAFLQPAHNEIRTACKQFEHFLKQITDGDILLQFVDVEQRDELNQPNLDLTRYRDEDNGVDIRWCKTPEIVECVEKLVHTYNYSFISEVYTVGWAHGTGLTKGDKIISLGKTHLDSVSHERLIAEVQGSRDETLAPLCFFHKAENKHLIICTPLTPCKSFGMMLVTKGGGTSPSGGLAADNPPIAAPRDENTDST